MIHSQCQHFLVQVQNSQQFPTILEFKAFLCIFLIYILTRNTNYTVLKKFIHLYYLNKSLSKILVRGWVWWHRSLVPTIRGRGIWIRGHLVYIASCRSAKVRSCQTDKYHLMVVNSLFKFLEFSKYSSYRFPKVTVKFLLSLTSGFESFNKLL